MTFSAPPTGWEQDSCSYEPYGSVNWANRPAEGWACKARKASASPKRGPSSPPSSPLNVPIGPLPVGGVGGDGVMSMNGPPQILSARRRISRRTLSMRSRSAGETVVAMWVAARPFEDDGATVSVLASAGPLPCSITAMSEISRSPFGRLGHSSTKTLVESDSTGRYPVHSIGCRKAPRGSPGSIRARAPTQK